MSGIRAVTRVATRSIRSRLLCSHPRSSTWRFSHGPAGNSQPHTGMCAARRPHHNNSMAVIINSMAVVMVDHAAICLPYGIMDHAVIMAAWSARLVEDQRHSLISLPTYRAPAKHAVSACGQRLPLAAEAHTPGHSPRDGHHSFRTDNIPIHQQVCSAPTVSSFIIKS